MSLSFARILRRGFIAAALTGSTVGCAGLDFTKAIPWQDKKEEEEVFEEPQRIVSIWNENTLHHAAGQSSSRGFGGRLMFYGKNKEIPIKVKGDLIVYAYDETSAVMRGEPAAATSKPTCRFKFTADKFPEHLRESTAGHAYDFWIPWDKVGGEKRVVSLAPVFVLPSGKTIPGEPKQCVLMGRTPQIDNVDVERIDGPAIERFGIQPASYEEHASATNINRSEQPERRTVETTTITIPTSLALRAGSLPARYGHMANLPYDQPANRVAGDSSAPGQSDDRQRELGESVPRGDGRRPAITNSPETFHPPLRARSALGQPPVPAAPTARPTSSQPTWEQYRRGRQSRPRVEHQPPLQPNAATSLSTGSPTSW
jgi:hypothetical protein